MPSFKRLNPWQHFGFEFLSIFIAVLSAFALNNWNDNRRDHQAETSILREIANGLDEDLTDIKANMRGHREGLKSLQFFRSALRNKPIIADSIEHYYFYLTRDFISIQNSSGYTSLKSRGLELVDNDSLRSQIISLYEFDYNILLKLEEEYREMQFQDSYFKEINQSFASAFVFNDNGEITTLQLPVKISKQEKSELLSYLWKIERNRKYILNYYEAVEEKIIDLERAIRTEIN